MMGYIVRRILLMFPTFIGITLISFLIMQLAPGNPISNKLQQLGGEGIKAESVSKEVIEQTKKLYGLDKPIHEQYWLWLKRVATLDFGNSFKADHRPVISKIAEALPITLVLNIISILLIYLISVPLGIYSAIHPRSYLDKIITLFLFVLYSLPSFWIAMMFVIYLGGGDYLNLFPIVGIHSLDWDLMSWWQKSLDFLWHLVLPVTVLTTGGLAFISRFSRSQVLEVVLQDYIRTARAKGLSERTVIFKHALRNALVPMVTLMGTLLPGLIGGSVIIEEIFSIPGMGKLSFEAILSRDYPTIMAILSIEAFLTLVSLLLSDLLYAAVDPRITFEELE